MFTLADGPTVETEESCFDFYNMKVGRFVSLPDAAGWATFRHDDGTREILDGSRVCSLGHARRMGWLQ